MRFFPRQRVVPLFKVALAALFVLTATAFPSALSAQTPPTRDSARADSSRRVGFPRPGADSADTTKRTAVLPGLGSLDSLPFKASFRIEQKTERYRNLRCNSGDQAQLSTLTGCSSSFLFPGQIGAQWALNASGKITDRVNVNIDYDVTREFDASNSFSVQYVGKPNARLQRVDIGTLDFAPPTSRFITSSLPSGNFGIQAVTQFGRLNVKSIFAQQTGNIVQNRQYTIDARTQQHTDRDVEDYQIERLRFFFTVDPALFGAEYPNIDILNRAQLNRLAASLPDTLRPTRVILYRLQFGAQPQNANGPELRIQGDLGGAQTYDVLREGVDYIMDPSNLWFALIRPLSETNERLLVAYNVRINGRDTVWVSTGGTPDVQKTGRPQFANLVMDPSVGPTSNPAAFRREIRSAYRVAGEELVRRKTHVRIVTGGGLVEHPFAGNDATFLQMFGLAQSTNPSEFDSENRLWPRVADPVFNLGGGAVDVRNGQSLDASRLLRDYFLIFPSVRPFARRAGGGGLVVAGNPFNEEIYTTPGEYLYSPQHPASLYRIHLQYETAGPDQSGYITLNATQMRPRSERVLLDGRTMLRELDYRIDYDLGRIEFLRADTLFRLQRRVEVRYEENPIFEPTPIALAGITSELPLGNGALHFTAINQSRSTSANRPQLGFQGASSFTTGLSGQFNWKAPALTALVNRLPFAKTTAESRVSFQAEIATSHPQFFARNSGDTWIDEFEGGGGISIPLSDVVWHYSSLPAYGRSLSFGSFEVNRASTLVWQSNGRTLGGRPATFTLRQIDSLTTLSAGGIEVNQPVMWLTLQPLAQAGRYRPSTRRFDWTVGNTPLGTHFRSIQATLSPSGIDLTRGELLQFWALVDTTARSKNPTLVFDFGDISENSLTFAPETLTIRRNTDGTVDSIFTGKKRQGANRLDSERDPYSHAFNFEVNDKGLPGDIADTLIVIDGASVRREANVAVCRYALGTIEVLGNPRANCTVDNSRLDEEDIDLDNSLNFNDGQRESERLLRFVVDLGNKNRYRRVGGSFTDTVLVAGAPRVRTRHWVLLSMPFSTPTDSLNDVNRRRVRALRLTVVSGVGMPDDEPTQFPIADIRVTGAPWINRSSRTLPGVGGVGPGAGFVITSSIGTNDSSAAVVYQPPPGVGDQPDFKGRQPGTVKTVINENSMRVQAGNMPLYNRAEAYLRFPSGPQDHRAFKRIRAWGRGRGHGWGPNGDLQMFVKVGRDENNFYLYHAPMDAGSTQAAWTDLSIDLSRFIALRRRVQDDYLAGKQESVACTGVDSAIVVASAIPVGLTPRRYAACDGAGYMVYTLDPAVTAPNLAAVQEVAAGIIRVSASGAASPILPSDTLELWVDDIRLEQPDNTMGVAGQVSVGLNFADLGDLRFTFSNKDPNFRQVGETPSFLGERNVDVAGTLHLEKFLPQTWGLALPLTINKFSLTNAPRYLTHTDIPGAGFDELRKPKTELTTYSLSVRRATPVTGSVLAPLINNIALTTTYVTGTDRTEYQDGKARNFSVGIDYLVTDDSARTMRLPGWADGALGSLPGVLQAGPVSALRTAAFRWNPTQFRVSSGIVRGDDRRISFIAPASGLLDQPRTNEAQSRLWRNGSVLEFRPTDALTARWEVQSVRDLRNYGDTSAMSLVASRERRDLLGANAGFERERSLFTSFSFSPAFSSWMRPRAELGTQYSMLRDPNSRALVPLPGVIVVDSIIATRDSMALASSLTLARRMTAAQTVSVGTSFDLASAFRIYTSDSTSRMRRFGGVFSPIDVSYTRSLLGSFDAAPVGAPLGLQFGLGGQSLFRGIAGIPATTAGQTGMLAAVTGLQLPFGTALSNRFSRTTTENWIGRFDGTQAQVDGKQRTFPDVALRWLFRPGAGVASVFSNVDASAGYVKTSARVTLPSISFDAPSDLRHSVIESFPITGSMAFSGRDGLSTAARFTVRRQIDSLPGSVARTRGNDLTIDAGRTFQIPERWQIGIRNDLRTRFSFQNTHNTTSIFDGTGAVRARLQDNGRRAFTFTGDASVNEFVVFTINGSHIITFDNNLNRRFAYDVVSIVAQIQFFGAGK